MKYEKIRKNLKETRWKFDSLSFKHFYKDDQDFDRITKILFKSFCGKRPDEALYAALEHAGTEFFSKYRGSKKVQEEFDNGSESEFSDDLSAFSESEKSDDDCNTDSSEPETSEDSNDKEIDSESSNDENNSGYIHFSHSKLRVCSGMKAIVLAHFSALSYFKEKGIKKYHQDIEQMYYEVESALTMVKDSGLVINKVRAGIKNSILHYDLNHCNAANASNTVSLFEKLEENTPSVVVLDFTSSTLPEVRETIKKCLRRHHVKLAILVNSGLKNDQGGQDYNPYGEIRIVARDTETRKSVVEKVKKGLSKADKLSPEAHEMVRACKRRGLAPSLYTFFKQKPNAVQTVEKLQDNSFKKLSKRQN